MPIKIPVTTLTYAQCALDGQVSISTIRNYANHPRESLRLPIINLGHRTKRIRKCDWESFKHTHLNRKTMNPG